MRADLAPLSVSVNLTPRESEAVLTSVQSFRRGSSKSEHVPCKGE
jgi:hypothetical protein